MKTRESRETWRSLKVAAVQYDALARCSEKTGKSIIRLGEEALAMFIKNALPVYIEDAEKTRLRIAARAGAGTPRKGPRIHPKSTQKNPNETVTIAS